jgi:hypothetical protein
MDLPLPLPFGEELPGILTTGPLSGEDGYCPVDPFLYQHRPEFLLERFPLQELMRRYPTELRDRLAQGER